MWFKKSKSLVDNNAVISVSKKACDLLNIPLINSHSEVLKKLSDQEISQSGVSSKDLLCIFEKKETELVDFIIGVYTGEQEFEEEKFLESEMVGAGIDFSITYAIYFYFLSNSKPEELENYLLIRRIPKHKLFFNRLIEYYEAIKSNNTGLS